MVRTSPGRRRAVSAQRSSATLRQTCDYRRTWRLPVAEGPPCLHTASASKTNIFWLVVSEFCAVLAADEWGLALKAHLLTTLARMDTALRKF